MLQWHSTDTSGSSKHTGHYRSLCVLLNIILGRSHERISAEIVGYKREDQLMLMLGVHTFVLLSFILSFAVACLPIVVFLGESLVLLLSLCLLSCENTRGKSSRLQYDRNVRNFTQTTSKVYFLNAWGDLWKNKAKAAFFSSLQGKFILSEKLDCVCSVYKTSKDVFLLSPFSKWVS